MAEREQEGREDACALVVTMHAKCLVLLIQMYSDSKICSMITFIGCRPTLNT